MVKEQNTIIKYLHLGFRCFCRASYRSGLTFASNAIGRPPVGEDLEDGPKLPMEMIDNISPSLVVSLLFHVFPTSHQQSTETNPVWLPPPRFRLFVVCWIAILPWPWRYQSVAVWTHTAVQGPRGLWPNPKKTAARCLVAMPLCVADAFACSFFKWTVASVNIAPLEVPKGAKPPKPTKCS